MGSPAEHLIDRGAPRFCGVDRGQVAPPWNSYARQRILRRILLQVVHRRGVFRRAVERARIMLCHGDCRAQAQRSVVLARMNHADEDRQQIEGVRFFWHVQGNSLCYGSRNARVAVIRGNRGFLICGERNSKEHRLTPVLLLGRERLGARNKIVRVNFYCVGRVFR